MDGVEPRRLYSMPTLIIGADICPIEENGPYFRRGDGASLMNDLYEEVNQADLVLANLPYIEAEIIPTLSPEVQREPRLALDGGPDGLDPFRRLFAQVPDHVTPGGVLLLEIGAGQGQAVTELAQVLHPQAVSVHPDLAGLDRLVEVHLCE